LNLTNIPEILIQWLFFTQTYITCSFYLNHFIDVECEFNILAKWGKQS
jgi:hypothetical protein